ncbi:MAG TPA: FAD-dependent oxidoreductase, partial [Bacteroidia bacterium]|nr:FAD-dependent oxidoreductase [Bacteroidia bacterium]
MDLSYWERSTFFENIDVIIVGSGIVGLNAALTIKHNHPKKRIVILERGILPTGASSKNAGFACFGSPAELLEDLKTHSENELFSLIEKRWKGLQRLRKNVGDDRMDLYNFGGYDVFDTEMGFSACADQLDYMNKHLASITGKKETYQIADQHITTFGFQNVKHLIVNTEESQIDTGKMIQALIQLVRTSGVEIINGVSVSAFSDEGDHVVMNVMNLTIYCKQLIITSNGFAKQLLPDAAVQPAALFEKSKSKTIMYFANLESSCLVEQDEEPPHELDNDAKEISLVIASTLKSNVFSEIYPMRKTVVDGSNTTGFQRTMLISQGGYFDIEGKKIGIQSICL